jgi:putative mRNA 3-end processing factor
MVRWLCEQGLDAQGFVTEYGEEAAEAETDLSPESSETSQTPENALPPEAGLPPEAEGSEHMNIAKATV